MNGVFTFVIGVLNYASGFLAIVTSFAAVIAIWVGIRQNSLATKAREAQIFQTLEAVEAQVKFRDAMEAVRVVSDWPELTKYTVQPGELGKILAKDGYERFKEVYKDKPLLGQQIYTAVSFLNGVARLADRGALEQDHIWLSYLGHFELCQQTLLPWWLDGVRAERRLPGLFHTFERMCLKIAQERKAGHLGQLLARRARRGKIGERRPVDEQLLWYTIFDKYGKPEPRS